MRRLLPFACVWLVIAASGGVYAEDVWLVSITSPSSTVRSLLRSEAVQQELHIDAAQWPKIQKVLDQWQIVLPDLDALSPEERDKKIDELLDNADLSISTEDALARALTAEQQTRLNQLLLQQRGAHVLLSRTVSQQLELTDEQKQKIRDVQKAYRALPLVESVRKHEQEERELLALLTPEQQLLWDKLIGPKFDVREAIRGTERRSLQMAGPTLLVYEEVRRELGITEDQMRRIRIQWGKIRAEMPTFKWPLSDEERDSRTARIAKDKRYLNLISERALTRVLSPEQRQRLYQLELQRRGTMAFADQTIADQLGLTEEQRKRVAELTVLPELPAGRGFGATGLVQRLMEERRANRDKDEQTKAQLADLLTPEQRTAWEKLLGAKFDFAFLQNRPEAAAFDRYR